MSEKPWPVFPTKDGLMVPTPEHAPKVLSMFADNMRRLLWGDHEEGEERDERDD